jgi:L-threonylcarbamoyladenylate synthase
MPDLNNLPPHILQQVKECADVLRSGGIAAYPTDTVYGLGAEIYNESAVKKIYAAKQRPLNLPLPVLINDLSMLKELVADIPAAANRLMAACWPGALTLVFNKASDFNSTVLAGASKIAIRMPDHAITLRLIRETGCPIVGTSANLHGLPAVLTAAEVRQQLGNGVEYILDAGSCPGGAESTIVDITTEPPLILRRGAVSEKELTNYLK